MSHDQKDGYRLFKHAETIIPGGSQLFGKRADLYAPGLWPSYYRNAKGCQVEAIDGRLFLDFTMVATGTSVLGYANDTVNRAVCDAVNRGTICTLNNLEEVELAEKLITLHPGMSMVRYARSGGEILSVAVRIARAHTNRSLVAVCGYHGWHDWYLSANLENTKNLTPHLLPDLLPRGVPTDLKGLTQTFPFNDLVTLKKIISRSPQDFAAIIVEPFRDNGPQAGYLEGLRELCDEFGIVLIFDEVTSGFRETLGGMYTTTAVVPDLVTFGKAMSNGVPMAALLGKKSVMQACTNTFISSTYWGDSTGPAAALASIGFMEANEIPAVIRSKGLKIKQILQKAAQHNNLSIQITGMPSLLSFKLEVDDWPMALTYIIQEMLERGFLANDRVYANYCHTDQILKKYEFALFDVFRNLRNHLINNSLQTSLRGEVKTMGFNKNKI